MVHAQSDRDQRTIFPPFGLFLTAFLFLSDCSIYHSPHMRESSYYVLLANGAENDTNVLLTEHS